MVVGAGRMQDTSLQGVCLEVNIQLVCSQGPRFVFLIMLSVAALRHALMELIPEPQGLSFKDTWQRVTLVARAQAGKVMSLGLKQAARAFQAKGTVEDKCRE